MAASTTRVTSKDDDGSDLYEGHQLDGTNHSTVWSVGATPKDAIEALCLARMKSPLQGELRPIGGNGEDNPEYDWGFRFTTDDTHCKAAGIYVPGGVLLTWWK